MAPPLGGRKTIDDLFTVFAIPSSFSCQIQFLPHFIEGVKGGLYQVVVSCSVLFRDLQSASQYLVIYIETLL